MLQRGKIPRMIWLEEVKNDLKRMKMKGWKEKMRNREQWRLVVSEAKAHPGLQRPVKKKCTQMHQYIPDWLKKSTH
jgi:hypothetical protein